jgi:hypothetical protein
MQAEVCSSRYILWEEMSMRDAHLKEDELHGLLRDEDEVRNRLILHHLAVCPECYAVAGYILDLYLDGAIDICLGSIDIALGRSRREAPALWEELSRHSFERQKALVQEISRFSSWGLAELLCGLAEEETPRDPVRARELATLAVEIASRIDEWEVAEPYWQHELLAHAMAHLGNAQRQTSCGSRPSTTLGTFWGTSPGTLP